MQVERFDGSKELLRFQSPEQVQGVVDQVTDPNSDTASVKIWKERDLKYKSGPYPENRADRRAAEAKNRKEKRRERVDTKKEA